MLACVAIQTSRPTRARNAEEKQQRRAQILSSAERLWQVTAYSDLSMNQIAREAHLAKGTLYLYFDTKEELFLALLAEHLNVWITDFQRLLVERPPQNSDDIADIIIESARGRKAFRRLLTLLATVIELNVPTPSLHLFYRNLRQNILPVVTQLPLRSDKVMYLLMNMYVLTIGWHQIAETNVQLHSAEAYGLPSEYQRPDFDQGFAFAVRALVRSIEAEPQES